MQLINLGFKVLSLRSNQSQEERTRIIHEFNTNQEVEVFLFNTRLGAQSLNLHHAAHKVIIMEVPLNMGTFIQVMGRVSRIGQKHAQDVYLLWSNHSYDQLRLHRLATKFVPTIAGEGSSVAASGKAEAHAMELLRRFLGQQYSTFHSVWGNSDFAAKDRWIANGCKDPDRPGARKDKDDSHTLGKIGKARDVQTSLATTWSSRVPSPLPSAGMLTRARKSRRGPCAAQAEAEAHLDPPCELERQRVDSGEAPPPGQGLDARHEALPRSQGQGQRQIEEAFQRSCGRQQRRRRGGARGPAPYPAPAGCCGPGADRRSGALPCAQG